MIGVILVLFGGVAAVPGIAAGGAGLLLFIGSFFGGSRPVQPMGGWQTPGAPPMPG